MGVLVDDVSMAVDVWGSGDDDIDVVLASSCGSPAHHHGISLGRYSSAAVRIGRVAGLMEAALVGLTEFGAAVGALPTINSGPFPGVVPATWWGSLTGAQQSRLWRALIAKAVRSSLV